MRLQLTLAVETLLGVCNILSVLQHVRFLLTLQMTYSANARQVGDGPDDNYYITYFLSSIMSAKEWYASKSSPPSGGFTLPVTSGDT